MIVHPPRNRTPRNTHIIPNRPKPRPEKDLGLDLSILAGPESDFRRHGPMDPVFPADSPPPVDNALSVEGRLPRGQVTGAPRTPKPNAGLEGQHFHYGQ